MLVNEANGLAEDALAVTCQGFQYQAVTLGCCDTPTDFCNLCENGGPLPNPDQPISADLTTCAQVGAFASFGNSPATCTDFQATTGVYCGCDNSIASASKCRLCGNIMLPDPTLDVQGVEGQRNCGNIEFFAQYDFGSLTDCAAYQDFFAPSCCNAKAPTASPPVMVVNTLAPTMAPTLAPTDPFASSSNDCLSLSSAVVVLVGIILVALF